MAISATSTLFTYTCTAVIILRIILGPFPLNIVIVFYYFLKTASIAIILLLTFNILVKTLFILDYDRMSGNKVCFGVSHSPLVNLTNFIFWVFVCISAFDTCLRLKYFEHFDKCFVSNTSVFQVFLTIL